MVIMAVTKLVKRTEGDACDVIDALRGSRPEIVPLPKDERIRFAKEYCRRRDSKESR